MFSSPTQPGLPPAGRASGRQGQSSPPFNAHNIFSILKPWIIKLSIRLFFGLECSRSIFNILRPWVVKLSTFFFILEPSNLTTYVQVTKYLEYKGKFSTCLRTQAGRLFWVWGALLCFNIHKSYKKFVKSTFVVRVPL